VNAPASPTPAERAVVWHDAECGGYQADLPLWRALADAAGGPVLDLGCGTGRVALDLASRGHSVTAVDSDDALLSALRSRADAAGVDLGIEHSDVRNLRLGSRFRLAIAPMQLLQLLPGSGVRREALLRVRGALDRGGRAAFALAEAVPTGDEEGPPLPDVREVDGWVYSSQPVGVLREGDAIVIRRLRQQVSPEGSLTDEENEVRLAVLTGDQLEAEAVKCGLRPAARHEVAASEDHVGSTVIELEAV
jgi:SAM-dependent methyltransferase